MSYTKPDVFVTVDLEAASFEVPVPALMPAVMGAHYHVVRNAYAGYVTHNEDTILEYPDLPSSFNEGEKNLSVDIAPESMFNPRVEMVLSNGDRVDITDRLTFQADQIVKPPFTTLHEGMPLTGAIYVSYRALSDEYAGVNSRMITASSTQELVDLFGSDGIGPANPLGFGMYQAIQHAGIACGGFAIGALPNQDGSGKYEGVITDEVTSYSYALDVAKGEDVYEIVPMTTNDFVLDTVLAHCDAMSSEEGRSERRMVFAPEINSLWPVRSEDNYTVFNPVWVTGGEQATTDLLATVIPNVGSEVVTDEGYVLRRINAQDDQLTDPTDSGFTAPALAVSGVDLQDPLGELVTMTVTDPGTDTPTPLDLNVGQQFGTENFLFFEMEDNLFDPPSKLVRIGDFVRVEADTEEMEITLVGVASDNQMLLAKPQTPKPSSIFTNRRVSVLREKTGRDMAEGIRDMAASYNNERLVLIGPDWVSMSVNGERTDVPSFYVAAQLAAELCLVGRQVPGAEPGANPFTGVRDPIDHPFYSSRYFTEQQLDTGASGGFTWLINDRRDLPVYTRDTLTTDMSQIETRKAVLGVERDLVARTVRAAFRPELRQHRIDNTLISKMSIKADAIAADLSRPNSPKRCMRTLSTTAVEQSTERPDTLLVGYEGTHLYVMDNVRVSFKIVV